MKIAAKTISGKIALKIFVHCLPFVTDNSYQKREKVFRGKLRKLLHFPGAADKNVNHVFQEQIAAFYLTIALGSGRINRDVRLTYLDI